MTDEQQENGNEPGSVEPPSKPLTWNQGVVVAGLVMSLPWLIFGPAGFGYYLDYLFGTSPWFTLSLLVVGIVGSAIDVFVILRRVGLMK